MRDSMAATTTLIPVKEYLATSYRPDREYIDGAVLERNLGEHGHSRLQINLGSFLRAREKQWGIHVVTEQRVQVRPTRFRVPDVCVTRSDAPIEEIFTHPPALAIEILSPDDRMSEMLERIHDYLSFGVPCVWLLDPRTRGAFVYTAAGMQEVKDGVLRTADPEMTVSLAELFD